MPYDPKTQYRGDSYIFSGGRQNVNMLVGWLDQFINQQKQMTAAGKSADFFMKANPQAMEEMGIHPDAWTNLGAEDKATAVQGYVKGKATQEAAAELAQRQQQLQAGETFRRALGTALQQRRGGGRESMAPVFRAMGLQNVADDVEQVEPAESEMGGSEILNMGLQSGIDPARIATLADSMARIQASDRRGSKDNVRFVTSPTGAIIALSADTGAFQYDPFSKSKAEAETLSKKDAIKAYNNNQARMAQIRQQLKMAEDPENANMWDTEALSLELEDLTSQQPELKRLTGLGTTAGTATTTGTGKKAAPKYKSKEDVVTAYKAGKVTRAEASKLLNEQFGVPFK